MKIKSVEVDKVIPHKIRTEGFYIDTVWISGFMNKSIERTYGPFLPDEEMYLVKFLNILEAALNSYTRGKNSRDGYSEAVEGFGQWFNDSNISDYETAWKKLIVELDDKEKEIINRIGTKVVYDEYSSKASLAGYSVKFYNTSDNNYYKVKLIRT